MPHDTRRGHLLGVRGLGADELRAFLTLARDRRSSPAPDLAGQTLATIFFEASTRTRVSFAVAAHRLGMHVVDLSAAGSSVSKGETLVDTARTVEAMGVSAIAVRTAEAGGAHLVAQHVSCSVLNAGDGRHEHPTQALADALTLADATGRTGFDFSGLRVAIVGDCVSSRVARSNAWSLSTLGAEVTLVGPPAMASQALGGALGVRTSAQLGVTLDDLLPELDAVMLLRIQLERGAGRLLTTPREYRSAFALTRARAARMKDSAWVMHPGPTNRGVEIDPEVADSERSLITRQVAAGVEVRAAALERLLCRDQHDTGA